MAINPITDVVMGAINSLLGSTSNIIKDFKADPNTIIQAESKLKELEAAAQNAANDVVVKIADIHQKDLDSARSMNTGIATSDKAPMIDKIVPYLLAGLVTFGFFGILAYMLVKPVPPENKDIMNIMLGSLGTAWVSIVGFYYGSSASSKAKDETIKQMAS